MDTEISYSYHLESLFVRLKPIILRTLTGLAVGVFIALLILLVGMWFVQNSGQLGYDAIASFLGFAIFALLAGLAGGILTAVRLQNSVLVRTSVIAVLMTLIQIALLFLLRMGRDGGS